MHNTVIKPWLHCIHLDTVPLKEALRIHETRWLGWQAVERCYEPLTYYWIQQKLKTDGALEAADRQARIGGMCAPAIMSRIYASGHDRGWWLK